MGRLQDAHGSRTLKLYNEISAGLNGSKIPTPTHRRRKRKQTKIIELGPEEAEEGESHKYSFRQDLLTAEVDDDG